MGLWTDSLASRTLRPRFTVLQKCGSHDHITCEVLKYVKHISTSFYLSTFPWWDPRTIFFKYGMDIDVVFVDSSSTSTYLRMIVWVAHNRLLYSHIHLFRFSASKSYIYIQGVHKKRYRKFQPVSWISITATILNWYQCKAEYLKFLWYPRYNQDLIN